MTEHILEFSAASSGALRACGLFGDVTVALQDGALMLTGSEKGSLSIELAEIAQLRVGYTDGKSRIWELRLTQTGDAPSFSLLPLATSRLSYTALMHELVRRLEAMGRLERVLVGSSVAEALFAPVLLGLLALAAIGMAVLVLKNEPWWGRLLLAAAPSLLFALVAAHAWRRHWPRPIRSMDDLARQLPPRS